MDRDGLLERLHMFLGQPADLAITIRFRINLDRRHKDSLVILACKPYDIAADYRALHAQGELGRSLEGRCRPAQELDEDTRFPGVLIAEQGNDPVLLERREDAPGRDSASDDTYPGCQAQIVHHVVHQTVRLLANEKVDRVPVGHRGGPQ